MRYMCSGSLAQGVPWLLPPGVRWLMSALVIGCISAAVSARCNRRVHVPQPDVDEHGKIPAVFGYVLV